MNPTRNLTRETNIATPGNKLINLNNAEQYIALGHELSKKGMYVEAEDCNRKAIQLNPNDSMAYNNLGWTRQLQGDSREAIACYEKALKLDPKLRIARRNLAILFVKLGRAKESAFLFYDELLTGIEAVKWMTGLVTRAMLSRGLTLAGEYATIFASLRWGSTLYLPRKNGLIPSVPVEAPEVLLTVPKLIHDVEQFLYLQNKGVLNEWFTPVIKNYEKMIERLRGLGIKEAVPLDDEAKRIIGHVYNRILHIRHTPRLKKALSDKWNPETAERQYLNPPGIVIIDDFLSSEALESIRLFCLESTVWCGNRYAYGRLGAFFHDGFNCPLLLQIAEELRKVFPKIIGDRYPLRQLWGFKNGHYLPADASTHADFAAVNANFWVTPDEANLDDTCGGLVIYGVDAPPDWDFQTYNGSLDIIKSFLQQRQARSITVPYKQNRAIIFNSDLFHGTAEIKFREGYENRRINITMLFGERENDVHHQQNHREAINNFTRSTSNSTSQHSAAFSRNRRGKI